MRSIIALLLLVPGWVVAQDTLPSRSSREDLKEWQRQQVLAAQQDDERRAGLRRHYEKRVTEIETDQSAAWGVIRGYVAKNPRVPTVWRLATSNRFELHAGPSMWVLVAPEQIGLDARHRRARLRSDDESANELNAARRAGDPQQIAAALQARRSDVDRFLAEAESQLATANADHRRAKDGVTLFEGEDDPRAPGELRELARVWLRYFRRHVSVARTIADFEEARISSLRAERASLDDQIAAARAYLPQPPSEGRASGA